MIDNLWLLALSGLFSGLLAGLLGIGGGTMLVPFLVALNYTPVQAVATSSLAIVITSISGSIQNWRMGYLDLQRIGLLGFPSLITVQFGVYVANLLPSRILLTAFGILLIINLFLGNLRQYLAKEKKSQNSFNISPTIARLGTGGTVGFLAGLFGIGGGVIMVPLQMLLLNETIKTAIQTSLGVIVITAISATIGHTNNDNVLFPVGLILGLGGLVGVQVSTRFLPKLPDKIVRFCFYGMLIILAIYTFAKAQNY
ncbi:MAG TPA: permease [Cyanothece sp. UBA12306]|nr:permease [Cyanothece sp. UBA12306]